MNIVDCDQTFNKARFVLFDPSVELVLVWRGYHRVQVYDYRLFEVDTYIYDTWYDNTPSIDEVERSMKKYCERNFSERFIG